MTRSTDTDTDNTYLPKCHPLMLKWAPGSILASKKTLKWATGLIFLLLNVPQFFENTVWKWRGVQVKKNIAYLQWALFPYATSTSVKTHAFKQLALLVNPLRVFNVFSYFYHINVFSDPNKAAYTDKKAHFGDPFFESEDPKFLKDPFRFKKQADWDPPIPSFRDDPKGWN